MLQKGIKFLKDQRGLTLIELLAVIVVLGIVAAIAVPAVGNVIQNSKVNADIASLQLIQDAAVNHVIATNPTTLPSGATVDSLVTLGYLTKTPKVQSSSTITFSTYTVTKSTNDAYTVVVSDSTGNPVAFTAP